MLGDLLTTLEKAEEVAGDLEEGVVEMSMLDAVMEDED